MAKANDTSGEAVLLWCLIVMLVAVAIAAGLHFEWWGRDLLWGVVSFVVAVLVLALRGYFWWIEWRSLLSRNSTPATDGDQSQ